MANPHIMALDTVGRIETYLSDISDLERRLGQLALWQPGAVLIKQAAEAKRIIHGMQARLDGRLVVTLVGPSGAGKSTLFNALAGRDELSTTGVDRPTTRDLVVLADDPQTARQLMGAMESSEVSVVSGPAARDLDHLILVDTPDTDSTSSPGHLALLHQIVARSDILICVFDAQNPKRRDHADFMAPLVQRFNGGSLVAAINKCDRLSAEEFNHVIGADFDTYLQDAWKSRPETTLMISARSHLNDPRWDHQAGPRHDLDQFDRLHHMLLDTLAHPHTGRDRRIANAGQVHHFLMDQVRDTLERHKPHLVKAAAAMASAEQQSLQEAVAYLQTDDHHHIIGINVRLYQALAQRWLGPVGWLVAIWSRLMIFGSGLAALMRFGNPLGQLWGVISSWQKFKKSRSALAILEDQNRAGEALERYRANMLTLWPDIAKRLVKGGYHTSIRSRKPTASENSVVTNALDNIWAHALEKQIVAYAKGLSHLLLQLLLNLPALGLLGYVGWLTISAFFTGRYLSSDFFLHALLTIAIVLALSFFLLQIMVRLVVGKNRIQRSALKEMERATARKPQAATGDLADQIDLLLGLSSNDEVT